MISIHPTTQPILDQDLNGYVFFADMPFSRAQFTADAQKLLEPLEKEIITGRFSGKAQSYLELTGVHNCKGVYILLLGLGDPQKRFLEQYRRALGRMVRYIESHKIKKTGFILPDATRFGISVERLAQETATMLYKASYHFDEFITNPDRKIHFDCDFVIQVAPQDLAAVKTGINNGKIIAESINLARYWCDLPGSLLTPTDIADKSQKIADKYGLKATIFGQQDIINMGMGGIYGVARGSAQPCKLVILEYKAPNPDAPTIALVGKGITFDTGGVCIKPAAAMQTMKDDMAGAAVVIATMQALAQLKPDINVIGLAPLAENMPGGNATKPGDILRFYNGKTAEVIDTDAEGRLVLADALAYAVKNYKLDAILDIATLTGACAHALGHFYAGLLSKHDNLVHKVQAAADSSGDRVWRLPLDDDYKPAIVSDVADIANVGSSRYKGGTITAAFFLHNFVGDVPWVHLDVAGTAFGVPDMTYFRPGATGFGLRLFVDLAMNWPTQEK
jgi:leucyl aminopeptidase